MHEKLASSAAEAAENPSLPIALFDSGVGGLTVLAAVAEKLPDEHLLYLGDTARVPYGTRSADTIARYTLMAASRLLEHGAKMLVVACNTATAAALPILRERFAPIPVLGVIEPGAEAAVAASRNGHIAVIATEATIRGGAYQREISRRMPGAKVTGRACTLFVPLAEEGWIEGDITEMIARRYLEDIFDNAEGRERPDTLLLGCTHFPLLLGPLRKIAGQNARIVDSAAATAQAVARELEKRSLRRPAGAKAWRRFLVTDNVERFARAGKIFLGRPIGGDELELTDLSS